LRIDERRIAENLRTYGPFSGTEAVMMETAKAGGDRQALHEVIRTASMRAWAAIANGESNPLARVLADEPSITAYIDPAEIRARLDPTTHVGDAPERALQLVTRIEALLNETDL
jgi:adenylosuccinate lyase